MIIRAIQRFAPLASAVRFPPVSRSRGLLSTSDRAALSSAVHEFLLHFRQGFAFSAICEFGAVILNQPVTAVDLSRSFYNCVRSSRDIAAYPFVNSVGLILFKPDVSTFARWLPFTAATSLATAAALRTIDVAAKNWDWDGRLSLRGWTKDATTEIAQRVGFQAALGTAHRLLPPAARIGGPLVRDTLILSAATFSEMTIGGRLGASWRHVLGNLSVTVSTIFIETGLFRAVASLPMIKE
jgi:hypothetical protein